jgi:hypothetical protein
MTGLYFARWGFLVVLVVLAAALVWLAARDRSRS